MPALAITDHGTMFGVIEFYHTAKEAGIKPIIGLEAYLSARVDEGTRRQGGPPLLPPAAAGRERDRLQEPAPDRFGGPVGRLLLLSPHRQGFPRQTHRGPDLHLRLHVGRGAAPDPPGPGRGRPPQPGLVLRPVRQGQLLLRTPAARRARPGDGQPHPDGTGPALPGPLTSPPTTPITSTPKTPNTRISCSPSRPGPCSPTPTGCA